MNHSKAIQEYKECLLQRLGNNLIYAKLFGSVARGTDTPESDIDVLVLVKRKDQFIKDAVFEMRNQADCTDFVNFTKEEVNQIKEKTQKFIDEIANILTRENE